MRKQFVQIVTELMEIDEAIYLLLGDIGVYGFRDVLKNYSNRAHNIGICEQATVSIAAGLSIAGFTPIVHSIAPFLVERVYEQLKIDFGYQKLGGNFVSVGASYDYAALGSTHHCPADIPLLKQIPNMQIVVPGTAEEFDVLFKQSYSNDNPTYFRLSNVTNDRAYNVEFGKIISINEFKHEITAIAVGPALRWLKPYINSFNILYCTTPAPLDLETIKKFLPDSKKLIIVEPHYSAILAEIVNTFAGVSVITICPDKEFIDVGYNEREDDIMMQKIHNAGWRLQ